MNKNPTSVNSRPIALRAASDAELNCGVQEVGGNNRGLAVETYLRSVDLAPGNPWCAAFVYFRLAMAAVWTKKEFPVHIPRSGYTPTWQSWGKARGMWLTRQEVVTGGRLPRRGDLCLFYFESKKRIAHIGIVVKVGENGFYSVEGNTSDGTGVDRDGAGVYRRFRSWDSLGSKGGFLLLDF